MGQGVQNQLQESADNMWPPPPPLKYKYKPYLITLCLGTEREYLCQISLKLNVRVGLDMMWENITSGRVFFFKKNPAIF